MPGGDGTGPAGMGPMTGRAAGYCAGYPMPGYANPIPGRGWGMGRGFGRGRGWGRGRGRGWGRGFGWGAAYPYAYGYPYQGDPYGGYAGYQYGAEVAPQEEAKMLKEQAKAMQDEIKAINEHIKELESAAKKAK
ncbi:MAG: DUF5320 domain-containing protein [Candidatus Omnitrophota bacterium]